MSRHRLGQEAWIRIESAASFSTRVVDSSLEGKLEPNTRAAVRSAHFAVWGRLDSIQKEELAKTCSGDSAMSAIAAQGIRSRDRAPVPCQ